MHCLIHIVTSDPTVCCLGQETVKHCRPKRLLFKVKKSLTEDYRKWPITQVINYSLTDVVYKCSPGGLIAHSLAIISDAAHLLTDFASFMIALLALYLAHRPATKKLSFGWYRIGNVLQHFLSFFVCKSECCVHLYCSHTVVNDFTKYGTLGNFLLPFDHGDCWADVVVIGCNWPPLYYGHNLGKDWNKMMPAENMAS